MYTFLVLNRLQHCFNRLQHCFNRLQQFDHLQILEAIKYWKQQRPQ